MAISDNRTSLTTNDSTGLDDLTGSAAGGTTTEYFIEGNGAQGIKVSKAVDGLLYDAGAAQNWAANVFYIWWNVLTSGRLDTKAGGGVRVRFCGATVTDWFEVYIDGSDTYTGGYKMAVVDSDSARALAVTNGWTNGTPPATSAVRYVGMVFDVTGSVSGNINNCFVDAMWRLPANTPGILVTGQNGASPWTWADLAAAADRGDPTKAWGTFDALDNGTYSCACPIRFGANDTSTHEFSDTNATVGFRDALVPDGFYGISVLGNSGGTTYWALGVKTGTGEDAAGSQGGAIVTGGPRWYLTLSDPNVDNALVYGATLQGGAALDFSDAATEAISCVLLDCTSCDASGVGAFVRNRTVDANTADGVAFLTVSNISDVDYCRFTFSDGHAIEIQDAATPQSSKGNRFIGYGTTTSNDAAIYNNSAGSIVINASDGSLLSEHTYRNGGGASTSVQSAITITFTGLVAGTEVRVYRVSDGGEEDGIESTAGTTFAASLQASTSYNWIAIREGYVVRTDYGVSFTGSQSIGVNLQIDRNFANP